MRNALRTVSSSTRREMNISGWKLFQFAEKTTTVSTVPYNYFLLSCRNSVQISEWKPELNKWKLPQHNSINICQQVNVFLHAVIIVKRRYGLLSLLHLHAISRKHKNHLHLTWPNEYHLYPNTLQIKSFRLFCTS